MVVVGLAHWAISAQNAMYEVAHKRANGYLTLKALYSYGRMLPPVET